MNKIKTCLRGIKNTYTDWTDCVFGSGLFMILIVFSFVAVILDFLNIW